MDSERLAQRTEALRFAVNFSLSREVQALEEAETRLLQEAPEHVISLNIRAWRALPETALPKPGPSLIPTARSFQRGAISAALRKARPLAESSPRAAVVLGDLLLLDGEVAEAETHYRRATQALGPLPPLLLRRARCAQRVPDLDRARALTVEALVGNPLFGSARRTLLDLAEQEGAWLAPLPLAVTPEVGPKTLRALRRRWQSEGLMVIHDRIIGLAPDTAASFRAWALREEEALRRFFAEGLWLRD